MITLVLHMVRTSATVPFKAPREMTWITGVVLFFLTAGLLLNGAVLKSDQEAVEAPAHNNEVAELFGFPRVTVATLSRAKGPRTRLWAYSARRRGLVAPYSLASIR